MTNKPIDELTEEEIKRKEDAEKLAQLIYDIYEEQNEKTSVASSERSSHDV